ncbi:MAG: bifunctional metallophosphatase/5'-nucleotidase [Clostridia bacterium]|nr:bifunctional metallophosphatase/5'-nucleotidase [Clostridia bacterium]
MKLKFLKKLICILLALSTSLTFFACDGGEEGQTAQTPKDKVMVLFTSDVHCGVDQGFGYAGLERIMENYESSGYEVILVDDGDAIQGEMIGTISKGETIIELMNDLRYDVAIPGNHEFDYGVENFLSLAAKANFPYISCNFNKEGELLFEPYIIKQAAGLKIAFIGVTTPTTVSSSTPSFFQNDEGEYVYDFMQDATGEKVYNAVQSAINGARADGADYVYVMGHLGLNAGDSPWTYADIIEHTSGIDVLLDGHSHDTRQVIMNDMGGNPVVRSACGTKMANIGYSIITPEKGIVETNIWSWTNKISAPDLLGIDNEVGRKVEAAEKELKETLGKKVATSDITLTISDPEEKDGAGNPIRMVRRAETNLGDFCADALLALSGADVAFVNGGGIRVDLKSGDVTYNDIVNVFPFGNVICVIEATGQQIADALEWGASALPDENGGFLQVAGLTYEIDVSVKSGCLKDENNMLVGIVGERRVKNIMIGGEEIETDKTYKVAGSNYTLLQNGDGHTSFNGAKVLQEHVGLDNQILIAYICDVLGANIGVGYENPYGQGRITIIS